MCFICWSIAGVGLTAAAIDKKFNHSKITNHIKTKFLKKYNRNEDIVPNTSFVLRRNGMPSMQTRKNREVYSEVCTTSTGKGNQTQENGKKS